LGSTDIPGRSIRSRFSPSFKTDPHGHPLHTFTKLPVAFSGGSRLVRAPVAPGMFSTYPRYFLEKASTRTSAGWPGRNFFELRFLEVGGDPNTLPLADDQQLLAERHSLANLHGFAGDDAGGRRRNLWCTRD
jgi:hypothetical protein